MNYFTKSYTGDGFNTGGAQGDRLTILADSSMVLCNTKFLARIAQKGEVLWSKTFVGYGGYTSNAVTDYDGSIVAALASNIVKMDTSGNIIYKKKIQLDTQGGYDISNSEYFRDLAILDNGDKIILYQDDAGPYGGYLFRFDKDMTVIKWCKNIQYRDISFTNMVIDGNKLVMAGLSAPLFEPANFGFFATFDLDDGSLIKTSFFNCLNLGGLRRLYKGNGQYFLMGFLQNQTDEQGRYCYIRFDADFNVLAIRRIVGYTDYFGTTFSFAPQKDNSLFGMVSRGGFITSMFNIDKNDSVKWVQGYLYGSFPSDIRQTTEALFFVGDWDYNAVGVGPKSTATIFKADLSGNLNNCSTKLPATMVTNNITSFVPPPVTFQVTDRICTVGDGDAPVHNYPLEAYGCSYNSDCNSIKLFGDTAICNDQPVYYTARKNTACNSPVTWTVDPAAGYTIVNDSTISVSFANNGNYQISCMINDRCNQYKDSANVHVNLSARLNLPDDSILCSGNTIKLSVGNQFKWYQWQDRSADSVYTVKQTGKYFITVKDYCDNTYSDTVMINPANFYFNIGNDTVKCNGDSLTLRATPGFHSYRWFSPYNLNIINDSTAIVYPSVDTVYRVTAEKTPGCFVKDSIRITALHSPPILLGNDTSLCEGSSLLLDAGNIFTTYQWSTGDVSETIPVNSVGVYFVKATAPNGCASADTLKVMSVNSSPRFTLGTDTTLCQGKTLSYNFNLTGAAYLWNDESILNTKTIKDNGAYWLKVTLQGCSAIDTLNVSYQPSPLVNLGKDTVLCNGITKQLDAGNNNATYLWQDGSATTTYLVKRTGLYYVMVDMNGCKAGDTVYISYNSIPVISLVKDTFVCRGQEIILNPATATKDNYVWQDGSTNISLVVKEPGIYKLTAGNECGVTTNVVNVTLGTCELYMPSAFTPNNDGVNDVFRVKNLYAAREFSLSIYNRYGKKIFQSNSMNSGWDGWYKGTVQNPGTYIWTITYIGSDNTRKYSKGAVLLIR